MSEREMAALRRGAFDNPEALAAITRAAAARDAGNERRRARDEGDKQRNMAIAARLRRCVRRHGPGGRAAALVNANASQQQPQHHPTLPPSVWSRDPTTRTWVRGGAAPPRQPTDKSPPRAGISDKEHDDDDDDGDAASCCGWSFTDAEYETVARQIWAADQHLHSTMMRGRHQSGGGDCRSRTLTPSRSKPEGPSPHDDHPRASPQPPSSASRQVAAGSAHFSFVLSSTRELFAHVRRFGPKFHVIADRWWSDRCALRTPDDTQRIDGAPETPDAADCYRQFCAVSTQLLRLRSEAVAQAIRELLTARNGDDAEAHRDLGATQQPHHHAPLAAGGRRTATAGGDDVKPEVGEVTTVKKQQQHQHQEQQQSHAPSEALTPVASDAARAPAGRHEGGVVPRVMSALLREHPVARHAAAFVTDVRDLDRRRAFLDDRAAAIAAEDCAGNGFLERANECATQAAALRARSEFDPAAPHDIASALAAANEVAAAAAANAEHRRDFAFAPGTVRCAVDDFVFLDLPSSGSRGALAAVEDYLERKLQPFVPAPSVLISQRIDALRCVVAAAVALERQVSRVRSATVGMARVADDADALVREVAAYADDRRRRPRDESS